LSKYREGQNIEAATAVVVIYSVCCLVGLYFLWPYIVEFMSQAIGMDQSWEQHLAEEAIPK